MAIAYRPEGRVNKFIRELPEITFSGKIALERGLDVRYITERAVFTLKEDGLHLIEIALASIYKKIFSTKWTSPQ